MKNYRSAFFAIVSSLIFASCNTLNREQVYLIPESVADSARTDVPFDEGWRFYRGDLAGAEAAGYDDSGWRLLDLPHDWSIEDIPGTGSPVDSGAIGGINTGYFVGGTGWYRKSFIVPAELKGKRFQIRFDGVYMNCDIWLNGVSLGNHPYGYTTFRHDLTGLLEPGKVNTISVRVRNEGRNSRWYSGSGIYRHVTLTVTDQVHLDPWHIAVNTSGIDTSGAIVNTAVTVFNESEGEAGVILDMRVKDNSGKEAGYMRTERTIGPDGSSVFKADLLIKEPILWSPENPVIYTAVKELYLKGEDGVSRLTDRIVTRFGIRTTAISEAGGFLLNDMPLELKGGCMHHDNGPLGAAAFDRAEVRRVELMKASGFNAIRCSHNPPSPAFLDACDRLGMLVIDEAFDMWRVQKNPDDYHLWFDQWWKTDIESMVLRDRNHPSVIFWSIGNEVPERGTPEGASLAAEMVEFVKTLDPTRMVTAAVNSVRPDKDQYFSALDIAGYNYASDKYVPDHQRIPERIMYGSESYPLEAFEYWMAAVDYPWVIGDFVWTGFDYLGESGIGWLGYPHTGSFFPWTSAYCGDIDICGFKRPQSCYRDVLWSDEKKVFIFVESPVPSFPVNTKKAEWSKWEWQDVVDSWNWDGYEGTPMKVEVYSSCDEAELFLNGRSLGRKETSRRTEWIAKWEVPYEPGILSVKGYTRSAEAASCELKTADKPARIIMTSDRDYIRPDGQDLAYVTVELADMNGVRNPVADNKVSFTIEGPGKIIAVGSSNPAGTESFVRPERKAYRGRCMVIVRSGKDPGTIRLKAVSEGLGSSEILIISGSEI